MFRRHLFALSALALMAPASDDPSGGGGGGGGSGGGGGDDPPKGLTEERVNEMINKALGGRDKRVADQVTASLTKTFGEQFSKLEGMLKPASKDDDGGGDGAPKNKKDPDQIKRDREFEDLKKKFEASEKRAADAEAKSRNEKALGELRTALGKHVRPEAVDTLVKAFRGDLSFDEDGTPMLPFEDGATTIDAAIGTWAKTDGAKMFLPAPNAGGSGTQRTNGGGRINSDYKNKPHDKWTDADREAAFRDSLRQQSETPQI